MWPGGNRVRAGGRVGESAIGTCLLLTLLLVVSSVATYTTVRAIFGSAGSATDLSISQALGGSDGVNAEDYCRGMEHVELWGDPVKWGTANLQPTAKDCCDQCRSMCGESAKECYCNSWVYCGDPTTCGDQYQQCWLKKQADVLAPEVHAASHQSPWTSGILHPPGQGVVALETSEGVIRVKLQPSWAPHTVSYIREILALRHCTGCQLYRAEGMGQGWEAGGVRVHTAPPGPPYALLQGSLFADGILYKDIPREAAPVVQRGHVCLIASGPDFFISLAHHPEWGHGHTVFGEVVEEDMAVVERIVGMPTKAAKWGEVEVQELADPINFMIKPWKPKP